MPFSMPMPGVRRSEPDEVDVLAALHLRTAIAGYGHIFPPEAPPPTLAEVTDQWRRIFADGAAVFVVQADDGTLTGEVAAAADVPTGQLARLYVDIDHWGKGIGARLHDAAVDHLRSSGCASARLWVLEANDRARRFYERRGWRPDGTRKSTYEPAGIDDVGYELPL